MSTSLAKLQQALTVEARRNYPNLQGQTARFADFVCEQLAILRLTLMPNPSIRARLSQLADGFARYEALTPPERATLIDGLLGLMPYLSGPRAEVALSAPTGMLNPADASRLASRVREQAPEYARQQTPRPAAVQPAAPQPQAPAKGAAPRAAKPVAGEGLDQAVQWVKGVGPRMGETLAKLGILTVRDLIGHYPRTHLDYQSRTKIRDLKVGEKVTVWGTVRKVEAFSPPRKPNMSIMSVTITDGSGSVTARWFMGKANRFQLEQFKKRFPVGGQVLMSGEARHDEYQGRLFFDRPELELLGEGGEEDSDSLNVGRIVPVYPLTEGLHLKGLRKAMHTALDTFGPLIKETLPQEVVSRCELIGRREALAAIHFPKTMAEKELAHRRLAFEEFFWLQLGLAFRRAQLRKTTEAIALPANGELTNKLLETLPFTLTGAQQRVFDEVRADLASAEPMNRLVQGDVGSGKTVVALLSLLVAVENGYQGALMAPTEILAEQHHKKFVEWLTPMGIPCALLLGKQGKRERNQYLKAIASGYTPIVVGTHALIQESVEFQNLGLVVIDEQHRFGVKQRATLRTKGRHPEVLTMTATPIPRTLALTMHGDLDVSVIDELPPGRKPIQTSWVTGKGRKSAWELVRKELSIGRQAYIVFPLIEQSEEMENVRAATEEARTLQNEVFPEYRVGLLHGQMASDEKEAVMRAFRDHELDILVATTVIEVGVDVPNASVMVIENAERFGLSQLHQLRGRVGRGADQSYCILVTSASSEATKQRMQVMVATNDGFVIAEQDLKLRGPGEFLGTRQSGLPDFMLADLAQDTALLEAARKASFELLASDPDLARNPHVKAELYRHFRSNLGFLGIG
ncbi:MAG TPA: ATP-dependent DNA helicase RecG [Pantanalinema sp.]